MKIVAARETLTLVTLCSFVSSVAQAFGFLFEGSLINVDFQVLQSEIPNDPYARARLSNAICPP